MAKSCKKFSLRPVTNCTRETVDKFVELCYGIRRYVCILDIPDFLRIAEDFRLQDPIRATLIEAFAQQNYFLARPQLAPMIPSSILKLTDDTRPEWAQFLFQWWNKQPEKRTLYVKLMKKSELKRSQSTRSVSALSLSRFYCWLLLCSTYPGFDERLSLTDWKTLPSLLSLPWLPRGWSNTANL